MTLSSHQRFSQELKIMSTPSECDLQHISRHCLTLVQIVHTIFSKSPGSRFVRHATLPLGRVGRSLQSAG